MSPDSVLTDPLLEQKVEAKESLPSATRTIRLEGDLDRDLEEIARQENLSVSIIINKALSRYVDWEHRAEKFGFAATSSSVMRKLFENLNDQQARSFGKEVGAQFLAEFVTFWFKIMDLNALLKGLEFLGDRYGKQFHFDHSFDGKVHTIIVKHDRGATTSAYYSEALKALFARLSLKAEAVESDQQVTITIHS